MRLKSVEELNQYRESLNKSKDPDKLCITICAGTGCIAFGAEGVINAFIEGIKKHNLTDKVKIKRAGCRGFCEKGPVVVILPKGIFYQRVAIEDVHEIISRTILNGEIIERLLYEDPVLGKKIIHEHEVPFYARQKRIVLADNGRIDPAKIEDYIERGGYSALSKVLSSMTPEEVIEDVKKSGLCGRGGGGFPTGLKWEFCRKAIGNPKYLICNADEGDPGVFMDRSLLEGNPHLVMEGMLIAAYAIGTSEGYVYVRAEYPLAVKHIKIAIQQAKELGLSGDNILGTDFSFHLKIKEGAGAFVCGEETALIASIEGKRGMPKPRPPFPAQSGLFGKPSNINNVETFANIRSIILDGGEEYAKIGTEKSKGTKIFVLAGKINNTGLVEVPMGTTLREVIFGIGGGIPKGRKFKAVQLGGPSGGYLTNQHLDLQIDYDTLIAAGAMIGSGGMIIMDETDCIVESAGFILEFVQSESCGKCTTCRIGTKRMLEILTRITQGKGKEEDIGILIRMSKIIKDTSLCGLGQTAPNPVLSTLENFRDEYEEHIKEKKCYAHVCDELYTAPCSDTCPVNIEVHGYVALIAQEKFEEALTLIKERNPFPSICGRVCHRPCETRCKRAEIDEPVALRGLKRFVADLEVRLESRGLKPNVKFRRAERVAIIGAGPAGLACACYLARKGYQITIFEALETPGGMLAVGIPNYRMPKKILKLEIDNILDLGVEIKTNIEVGKDIKFDDIVKEYNAVFVSTGSGMSKKIGIEGEETKGVIHALDFLRNVNLGNQIEIGKKVAVIGGSNGAIDSARTAIRFSASDVILLYSHSKEEITADPEEIEAAEHEGVKIKTLITPKKILSENGRVVAIECIGMQLTEFFDKTGRRIIEPIKGSELILEVDMVILATGRDVATGFLKDKIELTNSGMIKVDKQTRVTNLPQVFAGGDVVTGPATVIGAIDSGSKAGVAIDKYLNDGQVSKDVVIEARRPLLIEERKEKTPIKAKKQRPIMRTLEKEERVKGFEEVELGFTREMAVNEAKRCIRCHKKE
ncbi:FAD-dependent oxidoreductase [bacterium]|nr:FAD-dependent oxidoreductase [bacterium]